MRRFLLLFLALGSVAYPMSIFHKFVPEKIEVEQMEISVPYEDIGLGGNLPMYFKVAEKDMRVVCSNDFKSFSVEFQLVCIADVKSDVDKKIADIAKQYERPMSDFRAAVVSETFRSFDGNLNIQDYWPKVSNLERLLAAKKGDVLKFSLELFKGTKTIVGGEDNSAKILGNRKKEMNMIMSKKIWTINGMLGFDVVAPETEKYKKVNVRDVML